MKRKIALVLLLALLCTLCAAGASAAPPDYRSVSTAAELIDALADSSVTTIDITDDILFNGIDNAPMGTDSVLIIDRPILINGQGHGLGLDDYWAYTSNAMNFLSIQNTNNVNIIGLTIDTYDIYAVIAGSPHVQAAAGLDIGQSTNVFLTSVTISSNDVGVAVRGAQVTADTLHTSSNNDCGVLLSSAQGTPPLLTLTGGGYASNLESFGILVDEPEFGGLPVDAVEARTTIAMQFVTLSGLSADLELVFDAASRQFGTQAKTNNTPNGQVNPTVLSATVRSAKRNPSTGVKPGK